MACKPRNPNNDKALRGKPAAPPKVYLLDTKTYQHMGRTSKPPRSRKIKKISLGGECKHGPVGGPKESQVQRTIAFKLKDSDYQAIKSLADKSGMSAGQYCRMRALTESSLTGIEETQRQILEYQQTKLIDRDTMKGVIEYLNNNMPRLIHDYFQAHRAQR
jgi:hypothetical protein